MFCTTMPKSRTIVGDLQRFFSARAFSVFTLVFIAVTTGVPVLAAYHEMRIVASPPVTNLARRSTVRVTCSAEAPFELPYISFWWRLPQGAFTWLSDEDAGVSIRLASKPGNRTVTLDLWIGPEFYAIMKAGPNDYRCRASTESDLTAYANFTINKV